MVATLGEQRKGAVTLRQVLGVLRALAALGCVLLDLGEELVAVERASAEGSSKVERVRTAVGPLEPELLDGVRINPADIHARCALEPKLGSYGAITTYL